MKKINENLKKLEKLEESYNIKKENLAQLEFKVKNLILKQKELTKQNFNPHNQFLQTAVEIGFFGLLVFFAILFSSIYYGLKYKNYFLYYNFIPILLSCRVYKKSRFLLILCWVRTQSL